MNSPLSDGREDALSAELRQWLGPLVPALLRDASGDLDLHKVKAKDFSEFKKFLQDQSALNDGFSFRSPFQDLLSQKQFEPLLFQLYQSTQSDSVKTDSTSQKKMEALLSRFKKELVDIDESAFVRSHFFSEQGRRLLRDFISELPHVRRDSAADFIKAIARVSEGVLVGKAFQERITSEISFWNYFNVSVTDEEITLAQGVAEVILKAADQTYQVQARREAAYLESPEQVRLLPTPGQESLGELLQLNHAGVRHYAGIVHDTQGRLDLRGRFQGMVANLWLLAADDDNWRGPEMTIAESNALRLHMIRHAAYFMDRLDAISIEDSDFAAFNEELQHFLHGACMAEGISIGAAFHHVALGHSLIDRLEAMPAPDKTAVTHLAQLSDQLKYALEMGEIISPVASAPETTNPELKAGISAMVQGLDELKRANWYGYKQHKALSRGISQVAQLFDAGDITDIRAANAQLDRITADLQRAKSGEEVEAQIEVLFQSLSEGGALYHALEAAEMDGVEQVLGLVQTILVIAATTALTGGVGAILGRFAQSAQALRAAANAGATVSDATAGIKVSVGVAERMVRAAKLGAKLTTAENFIAVSSGEVRHGQESLAQWTRDAAATGISMSLAGVLPVSHAAKEALLSNLWARYASGGIHGAKFLVLDGAMEASQEGLDHYLNSVFSGNTEAPSWEALREIAAISFAGGGVKMGAVAETVKGRVKTPASARKPAPQPLPPQSQEGPKVSPPPVPKERQVTPILPTQPAPAPKPIKSPVADVKPAQASPKKSQPPIQHERKPAPQPLPPQSQEGPKVPPPPVPKERQVTPILPTQPAPAPQQQDSTLVRQIRADIDRFNQPRLEGIPGLTEEVEDRFLAGDSIGLSNLFGTDGSQNTVYFHTTHGSGAGTVFMKGVTREDFEIYQLWKRWMGFKESTLEKDQIASQALREFGRQHGLDITVEGLPANDWSIEAHQARYLQTLLEQLPTSLINAVATDGTRYLKGFTLYSDRVGAAQISAFEKGVVCLYPAVFSGPRRNFLATVLHEIGHSISERFAANGPPDAQVSKKLREELNKAIALIRWGKENYVLDWGGGVEAHRDYTSCFGEFLAEFNLNYVVDGAGLRAHIAQITDPQVREAYEKVYRVMKEIVYGGIEYEGGMPKDSADSGLAIDIEISEAPTDKGLDISNMPTVALPAIAPSRNGMEVIADGLADNAPGQPRFIDYTEPEASSVYGPYSFITHQGFGEYEHNEDAVVQANGLTIIDQGQELPGTFAGVFDGIGGAHGGARASQIAGRVIPQFIADNTHRFPPEELLRQAFLEAREQIVAALGVYSEGGAVAVGHLVVKYPDGTFKIFVAHVGDAKAIVIGPQGEELYFTKDHSAVATLFYAQELNDYGTGHFDTELKMRSHPRSNVVLQSLGQLVPKVEVKVMDLPHGARVLLLSDGISDSIATRDLVDFTMAASSPEQAQQTIFNEGRVRMQIASENKAEIISSNSNLDFREVRLPDGQLVYMNVRGNLYSDPRGQNLIEHYKPDDNMTVHVYFHEPMP